MTFFGPASGSFCHWADTEWLTECMVPNALLPHSTMRSALAITALLLLAGFAPLAVAAGFCAADPCCVTDGTESIGSPSCCGPMACATDAAEDLQTSETTKVVRVLAIQQPPSVIAPQSRPLAASMIAPKSTSDRLSALATLLI